MRRVMGVLAIIAGTLAFPAGAPAAQEECTGIQIQPARMDVDHQNRHRETIVVRNCEDQAVEATIELTGLGHDLDGSPRFLVDDGIPEFVTVHGLGTFVISPGGTHVARWSSRIPGGERSLYAGLVAEFRRTGQSGGSSVGSRSRVASMLLQRGPEPWVETAKVLEVATVPLGENRYRIDAVVEATGDVHINPTGRATISRNGTTVATVQLSGGTILPGFRRRLSGTWTPSRAPDGDHDVTVTLRGPGATGFATAQFAAGELSTPAARITNLSATETPDGAFVSVDVRNVGTVALTPTVQIVIYEGDVERARTNLPVTDPIARDASVAVDWSPALADGAYRVTARVLQDGEVLDESVTSVRVGPPPAPPARLPLVAFAGLLPLLVGLALWWLAVRNRRSRRDDEDGPPSRSVRAGALLRSRQRIG